MTAAKEKTAIKYVGCKFKHDFEMIWSRLNNIVVRYVQEDLLYCYCH